MAVTDAEGKLFLIVGASGVGKDSILSAAAAHFAGSDQIIFPKRYISRPADAGGEDHLPMTEQDFIKGQHQGDFLLSWQAHDLCYAIPKQVGEGLAAGRHQVINVSRTVIGRAESLFPGRVIVIQITASPDSLRSRLLARGRETEADIDKRLRRLSDYHLQAEQLYSVSNDGDLDQAVSEFIGQLQETVGRQ